MSRQIFWTPRFSDANATISCMAYPENCFSDLKVPHPSVARLISSRWVATCCESSALAYSDHFAMAFFCHIVGLASVFTAPGTFPALLVSQAPTSSGLSYYDEFWALLAEFEPLSGSQHLTLIYSSTSSSRYRKWLPLSTLLLHHGLHPRTLSSNAEREDYFLHRVLLSSVIRQG